MIAKSILQLKIDETPEQFAKSLSAEGDVFWWDKGNFWVVTSYELAKLALLNQKISCDRSSFFISRMPDLDLKLLPDFFRVVGKMMVMSDGKNHTRRRQVATHGMSSTVLEAFKPKIERTIQMLLDQAEAKETFDFASEIARQIPSSVLADLYGIREEDREKFYLWSDTMTQFFGGSSSYQNEDGIRVNEAAKNLSEFFEALIADRRSQPQDDFVSKMLDRQDGLGLSDDEVVSQAIMMLVAGQVTTSDQICNNLFGLLSDVGARTQVKSDPSIMPQALEELTRLDPAVTFIFRVVATDTLIGSQEVKGGDVVFISNHAVNRDAREFDNPHAFDPMVVRSAHLGYGYGPHYCLGASLARIEMDVLFRKMFARFPKLSLDPERAAVRKHHSLSFSGFESLPLRINHHG